MSTPEVKAFLSYLTNERHVAVATHKQVLCALLFLYKHVLQIELPWLDQISRPIRLPLRPILLTPNEVASVFEHMCGAHALMAKLMYSTGMRLMECKALRVKDIDFERREITIYHGKGSKDRMTMLPLSLVVPLCEQIAKARLGYDADRLGQRMGIMLPDALERKYPRAATQ